MAFLDQTFYDNSLRAWAIALGVVLVLAPVLRVVVSVVVKRLAKLTQRTSTEWDDLIVFALGKTKWFFLFMVSIHVASLSLELKDRVRTGLVAATVLAFMLQAGIWASAALTFWVGNYRKVNLERDRSGTTTIGALGFVGQLVIWSAVLLLSLDNLGVDVTALIAGLGVGGVAVALALQKILGDLFASLAIVLDKPFVIGDFIVVDDCMGSVQNVGLKTTRVRSLGGEGLIFSNADLLGARIRNYGRMEERRVVFPVGVTYQTSRAQLEAIPGIIRAAIEAQEKTRFDRSHFQKFGDFSLDFETVYYVLSADYNTYMDIQQAINLRIFDAFAKQGIEFAYPTQQLFVTRQEAGAASP